jgi:hypothetical protein
MASLARCLYYFLKLAENKIKLYYRKNRDLKLKIVNKYGRVRLEQTQAS